MFPHYQPKNKKIPASIPGGNQPRGKKDSGFVPFWVGMQGLG